MNLPVSVRRLGVLSLIAFPFVLPAHEPVEGEIFEIDPLEVNGRQNPLIGETISSSEGLVSQADLQYRPILRVGEILETIPGLIATQHSGSGKANQFFLRGFNLDHGTDFATSVDGMPVNMVTHGHGQGYLDLNFLIPEMVQTLQFRKGPYHADQGDFSTAGSSRVTQIDRLAEGFVKLEAGENGYGRAVLAQSVEGDQNAFVLTYALAAQVYDGPWDVGEDLRKYNGLLSYTLPMEGGGLTFKAMAYDARWDSADQIPQRAVESGLIDDFGSLDTDLGGESSRYSLSTEWSREHGSGRTAATAYMILYELSLYSNFTYFLDDPVNGDEFEQRDDRTIWGGEIVHEINTYLDNRRMTHRFGAQTRFDAIGEVGLFKTAGRERLSTVRSDAVDEWSTGLFYENRFRWNHHFRTNASLRWDYYNFEVDSNLPANSGSESASQFSPKFTAVYQPSQNFEFFAAAGVGFHSNDARGTTITVDPNDGATPTDPVDPLVRSKAAEIGVRMRWGEQLNSSLTLWGLELDSELLFVGDAGLTEPSRPSQRYGLEWANYYRPSDWLIFDLDVSLSEAEFSDNDPAGDAIPGAIQTVVQAGVTVRSEGLGFASLRVRHFGGRPLIEDGSIESEASTVVNLRLGLDDLIGGLDLTLDVLNLFDTRDDDITYFYASRLPGEPADGVEDFHYHVMEPRTIRVAARYRF